MTDTPAPLPAERVIVALLRRDRGWLTAWLKAFAVGTHPDPTTAMTEIAADCQRAACDIETAQAEIAALRKQVQREQFDLRETLRAVLHHFGPSGANTVTSHVMKAREIKRDNDLMDEMEDELADNQGGENT